MGKMFSFFSTYKWGFVLFAFLTASVLTWNISSKVSENEYNQERIQLLNDNLEIARENKELEQRITKALLAGLEVQRREIQKANLEAIHEILKDPVYRSCRITGGVRDAYKAAIRAQSASGESSSSVPSSK